MALPAFLRSLALHVAVCVYRLSRAGLSLRYTIFIFAIPLLIVIVIMTTILY